MIGILGKYNVKATFFVVGDWAEKYPESVKALADAGQEVMSHSNHHDHFNTLSTQQIQADLNACNEKIKEVTGVCPSLIRCPYGEYDNHAIDAIRNLGMEPIQWDVEPRHTVESPRAPMGRGDSVRRETILAKVSNGREVREAAPQGVSQRNRAQRGTWCKINRQGCLSRAIRPLFETFCGVSKSEADCRENHSQKVSEGKKV